MDIVVIDCIVADLDRGVGDDALQIDDFFVVGAQIDLAVHGFFSFCGSVGGFRRGSRKQLPRERLLFFLREGGVEPLKRGEVLFTDEIPLRVAVFTRRLAPLLPVFIGRVGENKPPACFRSAYFARTTKSLENAEFSGLFYSS